MRLEDLDAQYQDYIYVFLSTENQVINFIPLATWQFKEVFCLTVEGQENEKWDKRIEDLLIAKGISISETILLENIDRKNVFEQIKQYVFEEDKVFWNITGGQRPLVLAVFDFIYQNQREDDILAYIEGNSGEIVCYKGTQGETESQEIDLRSKITMEEILNLRGFKLHIGKREAPLGFEELSEDEASFYLNLYDTYLAKSDVRLNLRSMNGKTGTDLEAIIDSIDIPDFRKYQYKLRKRSSLFGEVFERVVFSKLKNHLKEQVLSINFSVLIDFLENPLNTDIDEIDTLIVTKTGQIISIEVKSGELKGDVAKGHNYTTYATSGIFGKPVFVTPKMSTEGDYKKYDDAIDNAEKGGLSIVYIDQLVIDLKNLLD